MHRSPRLIIALGIAIQMLSGGHSSAEDTWKHEFTGGPRGREFNIIAEVTGRGQNPGARIFFAVQDEDNCYRLDMTGKSIRFLKVEFGVETPIGTVSSDGLPPEKTSNILIKRRRQTMTAALNGKVVAEAYDKSFTTGSIGVGVNGQTAEFGKDLRSYVCGEIHFLDSFMTVKADGWEPVSGTWSLLESATPTMSANPFQYAGRRAGRAPAISTPSQKAFLNWDNYAVQVSVRDVNGAAAGWSGRENNNPQRRLVRVRNGQETVLASQPGGYVPEVWYRLRVEVTGTTAKAFIDDTEVLAADDDYLTGGSVALYTESTTGTTFDDLAVYDMGYGFFEDRFLRPCRGKWLELGGRWTVENNTMIGVAQRAAKAVSGDPRWFDYSLAATITPPETGAAGLAFYHQDELNYYLYRLQAGGEREIILYDEGDRKILASLNHPVDGAEHTEISVDGGLIRLKINGQQVIETFDTSLREGRIGLYAEETTAVFAAVKVTTPPPPEPVETISDEVFETESQMEVFASDQRDWIPAGQPDAQRRNWSWYRVNLYGDVSVALSMPEGQPAGTSFEIALCAQSATPATGRPDSGYALRVSKTDSWQLSITREGRELARTVSAQEDAPVRIEFSRKGSFLFARLDRKLELWAKDEHPLDGTRAGYAAAGTVPEKLQPEVFCSNLLNYTFGRSPVDWRRAAGDWEVTSRWSCDSRWAWFCGDARGGPAIAWNKYGFKGDFSIEFCGAIKMDASRGRQYDYARDMNVTVAADGNDLTTGYSFVFGGWNNRLTALARGTEIAAKPQQTDRLAFTHTGQEHRRWYYHKIERQGDTLRWYVDGMLAVEYTDPQPLEGDRIALWFYDIGVIVARVRISAQEIAGYEHPDSVSDAQPKTIYDFVPQLPE